MTSHALYQTAFAQMPLVAILRGLTVEKAPEIGQAILSAGFTILEVPLNSPQALQSIALLRERFPQAVVGAGTVLTAAQVRDVHSAGAQMVISPNFHLDVVHAALDHGLVSLPGVLTPSEAFAALAAGATALKLFPAEAVTPAVLKAMRAVLPPALAVLPVGGITPHNLAPWVSAGAQGFGIGSALFTPALPTEAVRQAAHAFTAAWRSLALPGAPAA